MRTERLKLTVILLTGCFLYANAQSQEEHLLWKFESGAINCNPLVHHSSVYCGSMDSCFYAIDLNTGKELWKYKLPYPITSGAAIYQKIVCVRSGNILFGFDNASGTLLWDFASVNKEPDIGHPSVYNHSTPVVYHDVVYFGDESGNINGVNIFTGKLVFNYNINKNHNRESAPTITSTPVIENGIIYFGDKGANMYAISVNNGKEIWTHKVESPKWNGSVMSEIVIKDSALYFGGHNNTFSPLNKGTGEPLWSFTDENTFLPSTPVFYQDKVIIGSTINSEKIHALNISTGKEEWNFLAEGIFFVKPQIIKDSVLVINSNCPFTTHNGFLYMLNCNDGRLLKKVPLPGSTETSPVYIKGSLLIGRNDGLYLIDIENM